MIKDNFIPYAEAIAMKELGFDEECLAWYLYKKSGPELYIYGHDNLYDSMSDRDGNVPVPTISSAFKWFRDKHFMMHLISPYEFKCEIEFLDDFSDSEQYGRFYNHIHLEDDNNNELTHETYEEAELACLRKLIELVKSN